MQRPEGMTLFTECTLSDVVTALGVKTAGAAVLGGMTLDGSAKLGVPAIPADELLIFGPPYHPNIMDAISMSIESGIGIRSTCDSDGRVYIVRGGTSENPQQLTDDHIAHLFGSLIQTGALSEAEAVTTTIQWKMNLDQRIAIEQRILGTSLSKRMLSLPPNVLRDVLKLLGERPAPR